MRHRRQRASIPYLGPAYDDQLIEPLLNERGLRATRRDDVPAFVAGLLADNRLVGWFEGRMEAGPARSAAARS
jgi:carbamoyltransferase